MTAPCPGRARPGDGLLHPILLGALVALVLNDRLLKAAWPGPVTGILSDVAGLVVAPLALQAAWEVGAWLRGRWSGPSRRVLALAIVAVAVGFVAVQVWPPASDGYRVGLAILQWPFAALGALAGGSPLPPLRPVVAVADTGDLLALPAVAITWWVGSRRSAAPAPVTPSAARGQTESSQTESSSPVPPDPASDGRP